MNDCEETSTVPLEGTFSTYLSEGGLPEWTPADQQPDTGDDGEQGLGRTTALLELEGISKSFPGVKALQNVHFAAAAGEVHALLGENGAGKSTLIKIVSGVHRPDQGTIRIDGQEVVFDSPLEAQGAGIATIYQELLLFPELTVAENIFMGHAPHAPLGRDLDWPPMRAQARALLASLDIHDLDVRRRSSARSRSATASASRSPRRCRRTPASSSWTSRRPRSPSATSSGCSPSCGCSARAASASSTSATGWRRSSCSPTGSPCCATADYVATKPVARDRPTTISSR